MALSIIPLALIDGILHASVTPLTTTEATLGNTGTPDPIPVVEGQEIVAVVKLSVTGIIVAASTYVVLQTDLNGDGTWIDVAWLFWSGAQGNATFVLCGGGRGAMNGAFQQTRNSGQPPAVQANGSNAVPLGGRVRFVGKTTMAGGSSSVSGTPTVVAATVTYKLSTPR